MEEKQTLRQAAQNWVPPQTLNIADLERIPVDLELFEGKGKTTNKDGVEEEFNYKYAKIDGKDYRIAGSIIGGLKALLQKMPNLTHFCVLRSGSGMNTKYQVIPVIEQQ